MKWERNMKSIVKTLLVTAVTAVMATSANAADLVLKFGHVGKPGSLFDMSANEFARIANAKLAGKAEVQVFGSSQLGKDKELLQKLKLGQIDFSLPSSVMSSVSDEFGVFEMPYIIQSRDHMKKVQAALGDTFQDAGWCQGLSHFVILGKWLPPYHQ
jgi:TRAP-type C4-dicarboxylate transport system substrate-binding protein